MHERAARGLEPDILEKIWQKVLGVRVKKNWLEVASRQVVDKCHASPLLHGMSLCSTARGNYTSREKKGAVDIAFGA